MGSYRSLSLLLLIILLFGVYCSSGSPPGENSGPPLQNPTQGSGGGHSGTGGAPAGNNPADFPTSVDLDFSALPDDPGPCSGGNTFHVAIGGDDGNSGSSASPLRTIVHALQVAQSGDSILVHSGTYPEGEDGEYRSLLMTRSQIRLCSAPGETVTVTPRTPAHTYGMQILANDTLIDGINLSGFPSALVVLGEGPGLQNIYLRNLTLSATGSTGKDGIATYNSSVDGLYLSNVTVNQAFIGIQCNQGPCRNWRFDRVVVNNDPSQGDTGQDAIAIEAGDNFLLTNVEVRGAAGDGLDFKGSRVAVFNANVHDNTRNGVKFWRGGDLVNSFVVNQGADAAVVFDGAGVYRIVNSLIAYQNFPQGGSYTMTVAYDHPGDPVTLTIVNSVFFNNSGSIWISPATQAIVHNSLLTPAVDGEIFTKGNQGVGNGDLVSALASVANASGNLDFNSNPLYVQPPSDFHFSINSPLKNAGEVPENFPSYDFAGNPRIQGNAPDLGPLELF